MLGEETRFALNPFIVKLRHGAHLTMEDEAVLARLAEPIRSADRGDIMAEGTEPRCVVIVFDGWACRYKHLENGKRQITALYLPGDLCEPFGALPPIMDHALSALTPVLLARVTPRTLREAARTSPSIEQALWWDLMVGDSLAREHMVSLGRRSATERLAHFFCEAHLRLAMVGRAERCSYDLPVTQGDLADLLGLSAVHVNRSLQELRASGLLSLRAGRLAIHDVHGLRDLSMFDPTYVTLGEEAAVMAASAQRRVTGSGPQS